MIYSNNFYLAEEEGVSILSYCRDIKRNIELVNAVREVVGYDTDLMLEAYMGWDLEYSKKIMKHIFIALRNFSAAYWKFLFPQYLIEKYGLPSAWSIRKSSVPSESVINAT